MKGDLKMARCWHDTAADSEEPQAFLSLAIGYARGIYVLRNKILVSKMWGCR